MAHFTAPDVTSNALAVPSNHIGLNYHVSSYTYTESLSGSQSIAMMRLPAGARVVNATLHIDNSDLHAADSANQTQRISLYIGNTEETDGSGNIIAYITSATGGVQRNLYNPNFGALNHRATSSAHVVLTFQNFGDTSGTTTSIFTLALTYLTDLEGD